MKPKLGIAGLALAALFFAVLLPPEAYPDGKLVVLLCSTFAFFASLTERRIAPAYIHGGLTVFAFLILHSVFISVDSYRSLEFISVLWAYYCLFGFFQYAEFEPLKPVAVCVVILCVVVSGYGLYQYFWGLDRLYNFISYAGSDQIIKVPVLDRIASKRIFSTLALPGTLWGFLTVALPFHAFLWQNNRWIKALLSLSAAMLLVAGLLTRSFGFLVGLFVLTAAWLFLRRRQLLWRLVPLVIVLIVLGGAFYGARRGTIEASNPAALRAKNWMAGWTIFAAHPMGTGLNTYGVTYPKYRLPEANETQYAHNTPLQLLSELGYPIVIAGASLLLLALRARREGKHRQVSPYVMVALVVWAMHNLIDINVYFPSLGVIGTVLLGVLLWRPPVVPQSEARIGSLLAVGFGLVVLIFSGFVMVSTELQYRAQHEGDENRFEDAAKTLEVAKQLMPLNSSLFHDSGDVNLNLYHRKHDPRYLEVATESFRKAIALSPRKTGPHIGLGLCLSTANRVDEALDEVRIAESLDPEAPYPRAVVRLLEQRLAKGSD